MTWPAPLPRPGVPLEEFELASEPPLWLGDGQLLPVGSGYYWGAAAVELVAAPSLPVGESQLTLAQEHRRLSTLIVRSLRGWENAGSFEVRYVWGSAETARGRLRMILIARTLGNQLASARAWAQQMLDTVARLFPPGYSLEPLRSPAPVEAPAWYEVERQEEVRDVGRDVDRGDASYWYLIHALGGTGSAWPRLLPALSRTEKPGFLSLLLQPTQLTQRERDAIDRVCSVSQFYAQAHPTYDFFGNSITRTPDAAAADVLSAWRRFSGRTGVLARIGIAGDAHDVAGLASLVGSVLIEGAASESSTSAFKVISDVDEFEAWRTAVLGTVMPRGRHSVWTLPPEVAPLTLERMPYFYTEEEAGGLLVLPVPDHQGVPGIPVARRDSERRHDVPPRNTNQAGVALGAGLHEGMRQGLVHVPLSALNMHTLVVGSSGYGKTTTVLTIAAGLWRKYKIPFLVIEPGHAEYRSLLDTPGFDEMQVVLLGRDDIAPMRLNVLEPPAGVRREVHASGVLAAFKLALPLPPPLPQLLDEAIDRAYERVGWDLDTTVEDGVDPPTLRTLLVAFDEVFATKGYVGEAKNVAAALRVRLTTLLRGSRGRVLDTLRSSDIEDMLSRPLVVELSELDDDDDKRLFAALLLQRVRASARRRGSSGGQLRHVTILEEAHHVLTSGEREDAASGDTLRADTVRAFTQAIAELRSFGEGFVLCSQDPAALAPSAINNTAVRIVHRVEGGRGRALVLDDMDAPELDRAIAARLEPGQAIVRWPARDGGSLIAVKPAEGVDTGRVVADELVRQRMEAHSSRVRRLLPYELCSAEVCISGCHNRLRNQGRRVAEALGDTAESVWRSHGGGLQAVAPVLGLVAEAADRDLPLIYCTAAHLQSEGKALMGSSSRDELTKLSPLWSKGD